MSTTASVSAHLRLPSDEIAKFCRRWRIVRLELFGSALRDDFRSDSDIDLLYTFANDAHCGWNLVSAAEELEQILGRPVDLVSRHAVETSLNWVRRNEILNNARVIYAA